jgi:hypothetical protein
MTLRSRISTLVPVIVVLSFALTCQLAHAQAPPPPPPPPPPVNVEPVVAPPQEPSTPAAAAVDAAPPVAPDHTAIPCIPPSWIAGQNAAIRELIVLQAGEAAAKAEERSETALTEDKILKKRLKYLKTLMQMSRPHR